MRKLKLQVQMTVDGYIAGPNGEMDWMALPWTDDVNQYVDEIINPVDTIVLGRKLAEGFIPHWTSVAANQDDPEFASGKMFTDTPKVVFTNTLNKSEAVAQGRSRSVLEMIILEALAHYAVANLRQAQERLEHAPALAQHTDYQRLFLDEGAPLVVALLKAVSVELPAEESHGSYARRLQDAVAKKQGIVPPSDSSAVQLVEPLSSQELRILRPLAAGLSNPELPRILLSPLTR